MIRKIIQIDEEKCNGCGACAQACHEGAIGMVGGKAKLLRDDYCDGLGDCLPACPADAIHFIEREAAAYNEQAVMEAKMKKEQTQEGQKQENDAMLCQSQLAQWPCQIKLTAPNASYFNDAELLIAADCTAYAYANMHQEFMRGRITLIGCPKLDSIDYSEKLTEIISNNQIKNITLVRMEVPCCGGLEISAKKAIENSQKKIPFQVITISLDGKIKD